MTVLVPLAYTGSVLALILAAGATSGVGIVILIPLVWAASFHQKCLTLQGAATLTAEPEARRRSSHPSMTSTRCPAC